MKLHKTLLEDCRYKLSEVVLTGFTMKLRKALLEDGRYKVYPK